jgi:hypothetical protein
MKAEAYANGKVINDNHRTLGCAIRKLWQN